MEYVDFTRYMASLGLVIALIMAAAWLAKRLNMGKRLGVMRKDSRLNVVETLYMDARHRVVIIRRDGREHAVLITPTHSQILESYDAPAPTI